MTKIEKFFNDIKQKKIAIIGTGVSSFELILLFLELDINVTVLDKQNVSSLGERYEVLKSKNANFRLGEDYLKNLTDFDIIFRTPGMYFLCEELIDARKNGVIITSEMETFFQICPCPIYAVTGSDGKTTTSTLISEILKIQGHTVHLGGNIGKALLPNIFNINQNDICVVELSSFQLISMRESPDIAVITNISPNHLDVHKDMAEYILSKQNILLHQNAFSKAILNLDDENTIALCELVRGQSIFFSVYQMPDNGAYLDHAGDLFYVKNKISTKICNQKDIKIPGRHNVLNYLAAICAVFDKVQIDAIIKVAKEFGGVEHRIEFIREIDGVSYYNDSIASSPTRTIAGLHSFDKKIIVIAGGYDKNIPYSPLGPELAKHAKILILMGATAKKIEESVTSCSIYDKNTLQIINASNLQDALYKAKDLSSYGDIVMLSPASASFDCYKNFEDRGNHFKSLVNGF